MCHVLIIEDEPLVAMDLQMMLADEGATSFDVAATEAEAVSFARAHPPQLITSDVKLLEGTGPHAVLHILRELGDRPVIFITGTPEACEPCDSPALVLTKPLRDGELSTAFRTLDPIGRMAE